MTHNADYITTPEQLREVVAADRLRPLLVRYRGKTEGRFCAPAQDVPDLVAILEAAERYVRDISPQVGPSWS